MSDPVLLRAEGGPVRGPDVARALAGAGAGRGDVLVVHSSLFSLGRMGEVPDRSALARGFVEPMLETVGVDGGIMSPTFSFDFCRDGTFDLESTPTTMGLLAEEVRRLGSAKRTRHPIFSYALLGAGAMAFAGASSTTCFGPGSVFDLMQREGIVPGRVRLLFLGIECPPFACTYVHALEEEMGVPYRYHKTFTGVLRTGGAEEPVSTEFFVRDLSVPVIFDGEALWERWLGAGIVRSSPLGDGGLVIVDVADVRRVTLDAMRGRIDFMCRGGYAGLGAGPRC